MKDIWLKLFLLFTACLALAGSSIAQTINSSARKIDKETGREMLKNLKDEIQKNYYDPGFNQVDIEAKFSAAQGKIDAAEKLGQVYGIVGQPLLDLNDQHTLFLPPSRPARFDYGFQIQMIGDRCFVTAVRPFSDAEKKQLKPGDEIISFNGFRLTRGNLWKLAYINYIVRPELVPTLLIKTPTGQQKEMRPNPKLTKNQEILKFDSTSDGKLDTKNMINWVVDEARMRKNRFQDISENVTVWKMPHFDFDENTLHGLMGSVSKKKALILDLRENVGGREPVLEKLAGYLFDKPVKIADFQGRKPIDGLKAEVQGDTFKGDLVVIIDSKSSGAAELLARVVQIEKRGTVIGDVSAGSTMRARLHRYDLGDAPYAASISEWAAIMSDGKCLEYQGVTPDELVLPTAADLAAQQDPVLARAARIVGVDLDPVKAGSLFPIEWYRDLLKE